MSSILDDLRFDQADLAKLCRQPEIAQPEYSGTNHGYGMGTLFREYAGLSRDEPLTFSSDHGVPIDTGLEDPVDFDHGLPVFLACNPDRVASFARRGKPRPIHCAFPIHYARALMERKFDWHPPTERLGTIVFPHKSGGTLDRSFDFHGFGKWIADLPDEYQPVVMCIYWMDYLKDRHLPYIELGLPVVTCGNFFDSQFLFRFIDLCSRFRYSCSNGIASSFPLSVLCGCHFFSADAGPVQEKKPTKEVRSVSNPGQNTETGRRLASMAPFPPEPGGYAEQRGYAEWLTGADRVLPPEEIREIQQWCHDWLLDHQAQEIRVVEDAKLSDVNTWLPKGVGRDGWVSSGGRLIARPQGDRTKFEAVLKFSPRICADSQTLTVTCGVGKPLRFECRPGLYHLLLPLPTAERDCEIRFEFPKEADLGGLGNRKVAFRFAGWRLTDDQVKSARCERIKRQNLPEFAAVPEGW